MALEWIRSLSKRVETKRSAFTFVVRVSDGCTESMFFHALRSQVLIEVPLGEFGSKYNLHYADDLLVLTMRGLKDLKTLKLILYLFESMTGLKTNFSKTCPYSSNMGELPEVTITETLNCTMGTLPITYLAASISSAGGLGGGPLFLPTLNLVAGLQIRTAASFSALMVTGGSLAAAVIYNLFLGTSLIDYDIALLSQPCLLLGTCSAGVKYWKGETEEVRRRRDCGDGEVSLEEATAVTQGTPWEKLAMLVFVWMSFFSLHILLGNKDGQSLAHIKKMWCWLLADHVVPNSSCNWFHCICLVCKAEESILGGLFGNGGGSLTNLVLLHIGVPPQTTAATTSFMVLFSSSMSSAQYLILGMKGVKQALIYTLLCIVGSVLGLIIIKRAVVKSGRASLIVFMLSIVMGLSTISITCFGAIGVYRDYTAGKNMGFNLPCR
ncbi:sulfite exporter TauE/SafE family protein 5-like [Dioscorea cayenensis subsp. rotundata]|uniref:Sulfite exporter TauE/SafE family protein 5-like n=1 Tax=Dioscorea cayennensis subsp. rotundata TaxID=55577 RepID=A0AB40CP17_DIOCR|nr:sulfite exporter TauE/SafE family protein 5-like [Dioscorea cayenensis subsp. rotundata]